MRLSSRHLIPQTRPSKELTARTNASSNTSRSEMRTSHGTILVTAVEILLIPTNYALGNSAHISVRFPLLLLIQHGLCSATGTPLGKFQSSADADVAQSKSSPSTCSESEISRCMSDEPAFPFLVLVTGDRRDRPHLVVLWLSCLSIPANGGS
jgi:hypothetical protein